MAPFCFGGISWKPGPWKPSQSTTDHRRRTSLQHQTPSNEGHNLSNTSVKGRGRRQGEEYFFQYRPYKCKSRAWSIPVWPTGDT
eukprot:7070624-Pyramimonas_sp.AAC.1